MATLSFYNEGQYNDGIYNLSASGTGFFSVNMNGQNSYFARSEFPKALGLADEWTISFWVNMGVTKETTTIFSTTAEKGQNEIRLTIDPLENVIDNSFVAPTFGNYVTLLKGPDGTIIQHVKWEDAIRSRLWTHGAVTYSGGDMRAYSFGSPLSSGVIFTDTSGTVSMTDDPPRKIFYGATAAGNVATISGAIGHLAAWNTALSPEEIQEIADDGFPLDLTTTSGNYTSNASLRMYYRIGEDELEMGKDFSGNDLGLPDIKNVTVDDRDFDVPDAGGL
jgi:hypothetical protein